MVKIPLENFIVLETDKSDVYDSNKKIYNRYFSRSYFAFVGYKIEEYNIQKEEVKALKYITIEEMIKAKEERKKEYVFTKWNTFDRHIKLLKKQREKILELER